MGMDYSIRGCVIQLASALAGVGNYMTTMQTINSKNLGQDWCPSIMIVHGVRRYVELVSACKIQTYNVYGHIVEYKQVCKMLAV